MLRRLELLQSVVAARVSPLAAPKPGQVLQTLTGLIYFRFASLRAAWIQDRAAIVTPRNPRIKQRETN
jgi:hypothetical protein